MVEDVDAEFAGLKDEVEVVHEPKLMPWGNRSVHSNTPKVHPFSLFMPVTDAANKRLCSR
jgi:hypothetical protein